MTDVHAGSEPVFIMLQHRIVVEAKGKQAADGACRRVGTDGQPAQAEEERITIYGEKACLK